MKEAVLLNLGVINFAVILNIVLFAILLGMGINELWLRVQGARAAKVIEEEEFRKGMNKAQVVDVREKDVFDSGHILGARSLPYSMLKTSMNTLRKDQPIYLYDQKKAWSMRAAIKLKKNGYQDLYVLKKGYQGWTGKIKKKKPVS